MQSSLLSPTSVKRAVARMRTVNATGVASAILCTYAFHRKNWQVHCGTLNAWNDDSTPQRTLAVKVVGSRVPVAQMAGVRVLQHGISVGKVVERVVIANEKGTGVAARWLVEHIPVILIQLYLDVLSQSCLGDQVAINDTPGFAGLTLFEGVIVTPVEVYTTFTDR